MALPPWHSIAPCVLADGRVGIGSAAMRAAVDVGIKVGGFIDGVLGLAANVRGVDAELLVRVSEPSVLMERAVRVMRHNVVSADVILIYARDLRRGTIDDIVRTCQERHRPFLMSADFHNIEAPLALIEQHKASRVYVDGHLGSVSDDGVMEGMLAKLFAAWKAASTHA